MKSIELLKNSGHKSLLPLQEATIAAFEKFPHVRLIAQTGSGKTLAYLLSALKQIDNKQQGTQVLILTPTRELTLQVTQVFKSLRSEISYSTCYGGHSVQTERNELSENPNVVIATPGRFLDHLKRKHVSVDTCRVVIIDEFDKCLEFGFEKEMEAIRSYLSDPLKTLFVSATKIIHTPKAWEFEHTHALQFDAESIPEGLRLWKVNCNNTFEGMMACLNTFGVESSVVFCNYREVVEDVSLRLTENGVSCVTYHGGLNQNERELALIKFRNGSVNTLVCTDLGSRGLDIEDVKHVVHYQFPENEAAYTHRNGRTARAANKGNAYILYNENQSLPDYLQLPEQTFTPDWNSNPTPAQWTTLYIGAGKKDKLRKLDIVGFFTQQGKLASAEIGNIDLLDNMAFVAVRSKKIGSTMRNIHMKRIKGKRIVIKKAK